MIDFFSILQPLPRGTRESFTRKWPACLCVQTASQVPGRSNSSKKNALSGSVSVNGGGHRKIARAPAEHGRVYGCFLRSITNRMRLQLEISASRLSGQKSSLQTHNTNSQRHKDIPSKLLLLVPFESAD